MNEELQSTNDELQAINNELRDRSADLANANGFLETILTSLEAGVAVVDRDLHVQRWNRRAKDLWGLRPEEAIGEHFLNLDIGLPTDQLRPIIRKVLTGENEPQIIMLAAVNRRGRAIQIRVVCSPLVHQGEGTTGAILVMDLMDSADATTA